MVANSPLVLFAHPSVPFHDLKELIAYSKANPRKLSVGTPGVGTPHHLAAAWLNTAAKIDITHVPYRGAAPAWDSAGLKLGAQFLGSRRPFMHPVISTPPSADTSAQAAAVDFARRIVALW